MRSFSGRFARLLCAAALFASGCKHHEGATASSYPPAYGPGGYSQPGGYPQPGAYTPPGGYPPPGGYTQPGGYPPASPAPATPQTPAAPVGPAPAPAPPSVLPTANDPINAVDIGWLRNEAGAVIEQLIEALPPAQRARVESIPFVADPTVGMVNAFAACDDQGQALMAISDGLLEVEAYIAQLKATDEIFGTSKVDGYIRLLAQNQRPDQPIVRPPPGLVDATQHVDPRKLARQRQLLDEQIAFVLGHELAHHHLGHTGCAGGGGGNGVSPADLGRALSRTLPVFNQPNEIGADQAGVQNLLAAGARQGGYRWTEGGAVLTLNFFAALDQLTPATIVFAFENTHPHPLVRLPIVQATANAWRLTGGATFPFPF